MDKQRVDKIIMSKTPRKFKETILIINTLLKGQQFAFRGTTSLVLQGYNMTAEDIDIIADKNSSLRCNKLLKEYIVQRVEYKETGEFKSFYGKFLINDIETEIMGEFQILDKKRHWSDAYDASEDEITYILLEETEIPLTKVEIELGMFAQMGRWNAFNKIKRQFDDRILKKTQPKLL